MQRFKECYRSTNKERTDEHAKKLTESGIRIRRRTTKQNGKPIYIITAHPDDFQRTGDLDMEWRRLEDEELVRKQKFVRGTYSDSDMLIARKPNEAGYFVSGMYDGEPYDESLFRLIPGGWDHEHCYLCYAKILPGDEWWTAHPKNCEYPIGLCPDCRNRLFDASHD